MPTVHRIIRFRGRVQGVGFRQTTRQLARDLSLAGTVCNLDDGRVELIVEGSEIEIDTLVERLQKRFGTFITGVTQCDTTPRGLPPGLHIIHQE